MFIIRTTARLCNVALETPDQHWEELTGSKQLVLMAPQNIGWTDGGGNRCFKLLCFIQSIFGSSCDMIALLVAFFGKFLYRVSALWSAQSWCVTEQGTAILVLVALTCANSCGQVLSKNCGKHYFGFCTARSSGRVML